jgi:hypothetical protein
MKKKNLYQKLDQLNAALRIDVADLEFLSSVYVEFRYPQRLASSPRVSLGKRMLRRH